MRNRPRVLCPIDFSEPSRAALYYAAAVADHVGALLVVLAVDDPLLAEVAASVGRTSPLVDTLLVDTATELRRFTAPLLDGPAGAKTLDYRVVIGKPATEILRVALDMDCDLIVMSSHGRSGLRKRFFGSTTERVLRETRIPVLVTPDDQPKAISIEELSRTVRRVLVPVDLSPASERQVAIADGLATALRVPLLIAHVVEPIAAPAALRALIPGLDLERRAAIEERLAALAARAGTPGGEALVVTGEPSEEIAKLADVRGAGLIVMGLHSSELLGPRMGSVTYRVLCLAHRLVLALPPDTYSTGGAAIARRTSEVAR